MRINRLYWLCARHAWILVVLLLPACAGIDVQRVDFDTRIPDPERQALRVTEPGAWAQDVLRTHGLAEQWAADPDAVLRQLDDTYQQTTNRRILYALAELSYLRARDELARPERAAPALLACVVYSYLYLDGLPPGPPGLPASSAARRVLAYYNYTLGRYLISAGRSGRRYAPGLRLPLTYGNLSLDQRDYDLIWSPEELDEYKVAYEYEAEGMDVYQVNQGIGVPLIAIRRPPNRAAPTSSERYLPPAELTYPATVLVRVKPAATRDEHGRPVWHATIQVCNPMDTDMVHVGAATLPLAIDLTTPLVYMIAHTRPVSGFAGMLNPASHQQLQGMYMLQPYQPDKIPVLFVHGLMSTPQVWLQMLNSLMYDPVLRRHYQFWFFRYPTGNPIIYSASTLRAELAAAQAFCDPGGTNAAFNRMVVVSHSMGGLLSKTLAQNSSTCLWSIISDVPPDQLDLSGDERTLVDTLFFFDAQPYVTRIVFMAVPHRGAQMADSMLGRLGAWAITLPDTLVQPGKTLVSRLAHVRAERSGRSVAARLERKMTGIDSLSPDNPGLAVLCALPITVPFHSIIGNEEHAGVPGGTDGVVPYTSAHLDGAVSELIVKSDHSVPGNLNAIQETRRILLEHLQHTTNAAPALDIRTPGAL